jgi:hypothetical protein
MCSRRLVNWGWRPLKLTVRERVGRMLVRGPKATVLSTSSGRVVTYRGSRYGFTVALIVAAFVACLGGGLLSITAGAGRSAVLVPFVLAAFLAAILLSSIKELSSSLDLTVNGFTLTNLFRTVSVAWADVSEAQCGLFFQLTLRTRTGQLIQIPRFDGCRDELLAFMSSHLPQSVDKRALRASNLEH